MFELLLKKFKNAVNDKIAKARLDLMEYDGFLPMVVSSTMEGIEEAEIDLDETSKDEAASLLREYAKRPGVEAIALIFMADTVTTEPGEERVLADDLREETDAVEAIMAYVYTREISEYRRIPYKKLKDNDYWFGDDGWKEVKKQTGRFVNPFAKSLP
jgi:hypothetical protein